MKETISIKELRNNMAVIASKVEKGESYIVIRRSKPSFKIVPYSYEDENDWETVIDFTDNGKKKGARITDVLKALKKLNK